MTGTKEIVHVACVLRLMIVSLCCVSCVAAKLYLVGLSPELSWHWVGFASPVHKIQLTRSHLSFIVDS
jgi:hypothetical protein